MKAGRLIYLRRSAAFVLPIMVVLAVLQMNTSIWNTAICSPAVKSDLSLRSDVRSVNASSPTFFFGIKVAPHEFSRRHMWRESTCAERYEQHGVAWKFIVGRPFEKGHDLTNHDQAGWDTKKERSIAKNLLGEAGKYGDTVVLPMRDTYMSLPDKLFGTMYHGFWHYQDTEYIGTHDIEYCVNMGIVEDIVKNFEESMRCQVGNHSRDRECFDDLYAGNYLWNGKEFPQMKAPDGDPKPYFSGWAYFLSRHLVGAIVNDNRLHTVLNGYYGTVADDLDMGKWVAHASESHGIRTYFHAKLMVDEVQNMERRSATQHGGLSNGALQNASKEMEARASAIGAPMPPKLP